MTNVEINDTIIKYETKEKHKDFMVETFAVKNHEPRIKFYYESKNNLSTTE